MAVVAARVTVDDTSGGTKIAENTGSDPSRNVVVKYKNLDGSAAVSIGGSGVTVAAGWSLANSTIGPEISLDAGESLYGIVASGTVIVQTLTNTDKRV